MLYAKSTGLRSALLLGAAVASAISFTTAASADVATDTVETVVVTGSHIPQAGLVSSSPLTTITHDETKLEGTTNVENLVNNLPSSIAAQSNYVSNGSDGTANLDLRGLGSNRTLVLVDGKRLPYGSPQTILGLPGSVNVNEIPTALVERVEVVTGGASAVYGSDAVAGVVNFIMRKDFEGIEVDGQYGFDEHSNDDTRVRNVIAARGFAEAPGQTLNGGTTNVSMLMGISSDNGKGNVTAYFTYEHTDAVTQNLYDISACNLGASGNFFSCAGSGTTTPARFRPLSGPNNGLDFVANADGTVHTFGPNDQFNFAPFNFFQRPDERFNGGVEGHYSPSDDLDLYTSIMFMDDKSDAQIAPSGAFFGQPFVTNCDNPLLSPTDYTTLGCTGPFRSSTADVPLLIGKRLVEGGARQDIQRYTDYRAVIGAKGRVFGDWQYDVSAQFGQNVYQEEYLNDVSIAHLNNALEVDPATGECKSVVNGSDPTCVPFNIFTAPAVSSAAAAYLTVPGFKEGTTNQLVLSANLTGTIPQLQTPWAHDAAAVALGGEVRHDSLELRVDNEFSTGDLAGQGGPTHGIAGGETVREVFAELQMPLVQNVPWVKELSVDTAARYSYYKPGGDVFTFKYSGTWKPIDDISFRAAYEHAVRAPNIVELFNASGLQLASANDLCAADATGPGSGPAFTAAQCARTNGGAPLAAFGSGSLDCPANQCSITIGGNTALKPEAANTLTAGFVYTPSYLDGFSATVDYFDVKVNHIIGQLDFTTVFTSCATTGSAAVCNLIHRGVGGVLFGSTGFISTQNANLGFTEVSGVDFEVNYAKDLDDLGLGENGSVAANFIGTYSANSFTQEIPGDVTTDVQCNGAYGGSQCDRPQPYWRHKLRVTWTSTFGLDLSAQWRMVGHVKAFQNGGGTADNTLPDVNYLDLSGTYDLFSNVQLRAGMNNVFDTNPPIAGAEIIGAVFGNGNTYPGQYDALGRTIFVGGTFKY